MRQPITETRESCELSEQTTSMLNLARIGNNAPFEKYLGTLSSFLSPYLFVVNRHEDNSGTNRAGAIDRSA